MAERFCKICRNFHNLDEPWPEACAAHYAPKSKSGVQVMRDIEPYKAVALDQRTGKRPVISSRSHHRDFLKANGYVEVGTEPIRQRPVDYGDQNIGREIKQTIEKLRSR
ncbi:MAG TPA: hypothetical protein VG892_07580 [Terriglobales bacterium]|nr:hypothetical protein [Terriglobales bacterium]